MGFGRQLMFQQNRRRHSLQDYQDYADADLIKPRSELAQTQAKRAGQTIGEIDDVLAKNAVSNVGHTALNMLTGVDDWKNAGSALTQGHLGSALSSAAWGALALGSTVGSAFVGPELKAAEIAAETARIGRATKLANAAKNIGKQSAIGVSTGIVGSMLTQGQQFANPTNTSTATDTATDTSTSGRNKLNLPTPTVGGVGQDYAYIRRAD